MTMVVRLATTMTSSTFRPDDGLLRNRWIALPSGDRGRAGGRCPVPGVVGRDGSDDMPRPAFHQVPRPCPRRVVDSSGITCLLAVLAGMAILGAVAGAFEGGAAVAVFAILALAVSCVLWWFTAWFLLMGDVRARVLVPTGVIIGLLTSAYAASSTFWMPENVTSNEAQVGVFGVALALIAWSSGAASCVLVGACAGVLLAEEQGQIGRFIRGGQPQTLTASAAPSLPPPARVPRVRNAFRSPDDD